MRGPLRRGFGRPAAATAMTPPTAATPPRIAAKVPIFDLGPADIENILHGGLLSPKSALLDSTHGFALSLKKILLIEAVGGA